MDCGKITEKDQKVGILQGAVLRLNHPSEPPEELADTKTDTAPAPEERQYASSGRGKYKELCYKVDPGHK